MKLADFGNRRSLDVAIGCVVVAALGAFAAYSFLGDNGASPHVDRRTPDPGVSVTPGLEAEAAQTASARGGLTVQLPGFIPPPATQLQSIVTSISGVGMPVQFDPALLPASDVPPLATLVYASMDGTSSETVNIKEIVIDRTEAPYPPGTAVELPAGTPYGLWFERMSEDGQPVDHYSFQSEHRRTIIAFTGPASPSQADVIKMYESMQ